MTATISFAPWPHVPCCSHRRDLNSLPRLQVSLLMLTCTLHMARLLQRHLYDPGYVQLFQLRLHSSLLVPSMWEHIMHVQPLPAREVPVPLWWERTILLLQILVQGLFLFLNRVPSFFLWSTLVNPNLKGTMVLIQLTVISCIINFVFPFFSGIQARRAEILLTLFPQPVGSSMRLFYRKPVIMFRTSLISLWRSPATRTSLSCSTRILMSLTPTVLTFYEQRYLEYDILLIVRGLLRRPCLSGSPTVTFYSVQYQSAWTQQRHAQ